MKDKFFSLITAVIEKLISIIWKSDTKSQSRSKIEIQDIAAGRDVIINVIYRDEHNLEEIQRVSIRELVNTQLQNQLTKEKNSKKYIPDIFVEIAQVKDQARYFSHPTLFFQKVLDEVERLNFNDANRVLQKLSLPSIQFDWRDNSYPTITIDETYESISSLNNVLIQINNVLYPYSYPWRNSTSLEMTEIPPSKQYVYKDMRYFLGGEVSSVMSKIDKLLDHLELMSSPILFIVGRAGQGKTNFVCNFAEAVLVKRDIPCIFFTGREFNHVAPERIGEYFVNSIFGDKFGGLDNSLDYLSKLAVESNTPVIIIIDGINEHKNIQDFAHHLEKFVEKVLQYKHIKLILTCRTEYFEERFSNFRQSSFAREIRFVDDLERYMSEMHQVQMVEGYFRFFNLPLSSLSQPAAETLEKDTLLLRMFCEAYGDENAKEEIQLSNVINIYREKIFREYFNRKIDDMTEYDGDTSRIRVKPREKYSQVLDHIIMLMIEQGQYANIPTTDLPSGYDNEVGNLLGEDIIVRKDLVTTDDPFNDPVEVISFTFDEFRDFLIAKHLINSVFQQDQQKFNKVVDRVIAPKSSIAEGVATYLFFASRRANGRDILNVIDRKEWYRGIFVKSIFSVEEELITQADRDEIKTSFYENVGNAYWIIRMLVQRWRTTLYPQLNIRLLFEIFNELDKDVYDKLVKPSVRGWRHAFEESYIKLLTSQLEVKLDDKDFVDDTDFVNFMELLIFFFPIFDEEPLDLPAFHAFNKFAELKPGIAITLLKKHTRNPHSEIQTQVWRMLTYVENMEIPAELVEEACDLLLEFDEAGFRDSVSVIKEIVRFLEKCAIENNQSYPKAVVEQMERYFFLPYLDELTDDIGT
ncbi:MAG: NACHT domain-containing protein [Anaerolineae bacterium]|nr:NACHT domain-containing protein [Anaerolineae bacterium]